MPFDYQKDWKSFLKSDQTHTIDYLTTTAATLKQLGLVKSALCDNLRLAITAKTSEAEPQGSLLIDLIDNDSQFIWYLIARYGEHHLGANLFSYTLKPSIFALTQSITAFALELMNFSERNFNRPLYVFDGASCESRVPFSTLLVESADLLIRQAKRLNEVTNEHLVYYCHLQTNADSTALPAEEQLKAALGHKEFSFATNPSLRLAIFRDEFTSSLKTIAATLRETISQVTKNTGDIGEFPVWITLDWLASEVTQLDQIEFPKGGSLKSWELRRLSFGTKSLKLRQAFEILTREILKTLEVAKDARIKDTLPRALQRQMTCTLFQNGVDIIDAWQAVENLMQYVSDKNIDPQQLISGELKKIDKNLRPECLEILQDHLKDASFISENAPAKEKTYQRLKSLRRSIDKMSSLTPILLLCVGGLLGCGMKPLSLKSDVVDFRPEIPYQTLSEGESTTSDKKGQKQDEEHKN